MEATPISAPAAGAWDGHHATRVSKGRCGNSSLACRPDAAGAVQAGCAGRVRAARPGGLGGAPTRVDVDAAVGVARNGGAHGVGHAHAQRAASLGVLERAEGVGGLARLQARPREEQGFASRSGGWMMPRCWASRHAVGVLHSAGWMDAWHPNWQACRAAHLGDKDAGVIAEDGAAAVQQVGGQLQHHRDLGQLLHGLAAGHGGVEAGAAGNEHQAARAADGLRGCGANGGGVRRHSRVGDLTCARLASKQHGSGTSAVWLLASSTAPAHQQSRPRLGCASMCPVPNLPCPRRRGSPTRGPPGRPCARGA